VLKVDRKNIFIFTSIAILVPISLKIFGAFAFAALIDKNIELQQSYSFSNVWGSKGTGDGKFLRPHDLEFDNHNKYLYAVDRDGNRIQVFDKNGTFLFKFGQKGDGGGQF
jgi:DNA-binding beta-propeller fold protein YncE